MEVMAKPSALAAIPDELRVRLRSGSPVDRVDLAAFARHARAATDCALVSRALKQLPPDVPGWRTLRVAVLRTCTVEPLVPQFETAALRRDLRAIFSLGDFNSITQDLLADNPGFARDGVDVVVLWTRLADLDSACWSAAGEPAAAAIDAVLGRVTDWASRASARWGRPVLVTNFEQPRMATPGLYDALHAGASRSTIGELNRRLAAALAEIAGVHVLDVAGAQWQVGLGSWFDDKMAVIAGLPYAAAAHPVLADTVGRTLRALVTPPRKCLVVDLDNTLWGGVLGEDGADGIKLGPDHPGIFYQDFQRQILALRERGILLAIASKNNPDETMAVLSGHARMVLRPGHFAAKRINWNDKTASLREIAQELNIGTDALVFLDDNPAECARIRQAMPEVLTVEAPTDPLKLGDTLRNLEAFDALTISQEDRRRGAMYQEQARRQELRGQSGSIEDFYRSLKMVLTIGEADRATIARIAQLTQKTNQFNLTTLRCTEEQIAQIAAAGTHRIFWVRVEDAFGDNGLVAIAMVRVAGETWEMENLLMSCRVIQRTVETALLAHVAAQARQAGARRLRGEIRFTPKNAPARDFYRQHGFRLKGESSTNQTWEGDLRELNLDSPPWFSIHRPS